jgi:hypothetical protein
MDKTKITKVLLVAILIVNVNLVSAQSYKSDTLCYHRIIKNEKGEYLSWYKPEVSGAGFDQVVKLASGFMKSGCPVEPKTGLELYLLFCEFFGPDMNPDFYKGTTGNYSAPNNPTCTFAGLVQSFAVDYRVYSGDTSYLSIVRKCLDHQLRNGTTPSDWKWASVPYASADAGETIYQGAIHGSPEGGGDGLHVIEPDKVGELGMGYLLFYEITSEIRFLNAAMNCANALARNINQGFGFELQNNLFISANPRSPWPFRVNAQTDNIMEDYCSNVIEPIRLFDELISLSDQLKLDKAKKAEYIAARDIAWQWLFSLEGPMKTSIWKAYFEDVKRDQFNQNRVNVTPVETARYLLKNPHSNPYSLIHATALINWVGSVFGTDGTHEMPAINEQLWCYQLMGSHTARYASICALLYEQTGDERWKTKAYEYFNWATYCCSKAGIVATGPFWPSVWFTDGYRDYIKHFLEGLAAIPEWAPANENHLLKSSSVITKIAYNNNEVQYSTFRNNSHEVLRLNFNPSKVLINNVELKRDKTLTKNGFTWQPIGNKGGILKISHEIGNDIEIN